MLTQAIIIKKQNTNEYDQLIVCYTKEFGKITAIAKSILKPGSVQAMHLDVLNLVEFDLVGGSASWRMPIITGAQCEKPYRGIKNSLPAFAAASFIIEVLDKIIFDGEKDGELWKFVVGVLEKLEINPGNLLPFFRNSQAELLKLLGYFPMLERCVLCSLEMNPERSRTRDKSAALYGMKNTEGWSLSLEMGGALCKNCFLRGAKGMLLKTADWACLAGGRDYSNSSGLSELPAEPKRSILDGLFEHTFDTRFKSLDFLYQVIK